MPLVNLKDLLGHARREGYAIGASRIDGLEALEAVLDACEADRAPAILSLVEKSLGAGRFATLMPAVVGAARHSTVPAAIHLDACMDLDGLVRAIRLGCTAATLDASGLPYEENLALTREAAQLAHGCGVPLGGVLKDSEAFEAFVAETGVDWLERPAMDASSNLPLTSRVEPGLDGDACRRLIGTGVAMIDASAALAAAAAAGVREAFAAQTEYAALMQSVRAAVRIEAGRQNRILGAAGRAEAAADACRPWREVEHAICFNFDAALGEDEVAAMLARGCEQLLRVPGVRRVDAGEALTEGARYRLFWDIRFASEAVVETYWRHPEHVDYADNVFRPHASDRLKIDYRLLP